MWPFTRRKPNPPPTFNQAKLGGQPMHINPDRAAMRGRNEARMERLRIQIAKMEREGKDATTFRQELARREKGIAKKPKVGE